MGENGRLRGERAFGAGYAGLARVDSAGHAEGPGGGFENRLADVVRIPAVRNLHMQVAEQVGGQRLEEILDQFAIKIANLRAGKAGR